MKEIHIGEKITAKRKEKGLTQQELADHLGVSKPAVSKWESSQSYPDIALIPTIASYFDISVDELFDYQPQLTKQAIAKIYMNLAKKFTDEGFEIAYAELSAVIKKYYACWPLLQNMGVLLLNYASMAENPKRTEEVLSEAIALFDRIADYCEDVSTLRKLPYLKATAYLMLGRPSDVIDLLEDEREIAMSPDILLANAYAMRNESEKAVSLLQGSIFIGVLGILSAYPGLIWQYKEDPHTLDQWMHTALGVIELFDLDTTHPGTILPIHINAAVLYLTIGQPSKCLDSLERYTKIVTSPEIFPLVLKGNKLFNRIDHLFDSFDLGTAAPRSDAAIKQSMKDVILNQPAFVSLAGEERFQKIVRAIEAL